MLGDLKDRSKILKDLVAATRHEDVSMIIPDEFLGTPEIASAKPAPRFILFLL